jgi:cytochrome c biogenesis protein CcmG, thiol:disulfide interchange protein DsbE
MKWLIRCAGVLYAPRKTFRLLISGSQGGFLDILALMLVIMLGTAPLAILRVLLSSQSDMSIILTRFFSMYLSFVLTPLAVCVGLGLVLAGAGRLRGQGSAIESTISTSVYLWVPVGVLGLLGAMLQGVGLDLWVLPHIPLSFFLQSEPAWWMYPVRLLVSYGWSIYLILILRRVIHEDKKPKPDAPSKKAAWFLVGWILLAYLAGSLSAAHNYDKIRPIMVGDQAAEFSLTKIEGTGEISLFEQAGKIVVLDFWATWCPKCVETMPGLIAWAKEHPEVKVVAVHQGSSVEEVAEFVKGKGWTGIDFVVDQTGQVSAAYRADTLPAYFVVAKDQKIRAATIGTVPKGWLDTNTKSEPVR